jgi:hypothetical protein
MDAIHSLDLVTEKNVYPLASMAAACNVGSDHLNQANNCNVTAILVLPCLINYHRYFRAVNFQQGLI